VVDGGRGCAGRTVAARRSGRRVLQLETVAFETSLHGTTGGGQLASTLASSNCELSNRPLQRTGANGPLSVDGHRAGAARLFKDTVGRRAAPAVLLSTITYRPLPLNGTPLDGAFEETAMSEHCVKVTVPFQGTDLGPIFELEDQLITAIENSAAGEFDGNEVGESEAVLYMYGPDADALYAAVVPVLRSSPIARTGTIILRYGPPEDGTREVRLAIALAPV